jgi:hypothetical protein
MAMSLLGQVLALVLSFPAVGLLLYALTTAERWALSDPSRGKPPRHRHRRAAPSARRAARLGPPAWSGPSAAA